LVSNVFERGLRASRLVILVAVVSPASFWRSGRSGSPWSTCTIASPCWWTNADPSLDPRAYPDLRSDAVTTIVKALAGFLIDPPPGLRVRALRAVRGRHERRRGRRSRPRLLVVSSLNDLEEKVARVVLQALAIEFFGRALNLEYARALDLLYLAGGILLVSAALYLSGLRPTPNPAPPTPR
jgi:hypothetical protein